jgi:methionyl aminopeptidase
MTVTLKTPEDIAKMRIAGKLAADVLEMIAEHVKPGITTEELDRICHDYIVNEQKAIPAPLNYKGFPKSICTVPVWAERLSQVTQECMYKAIEIVKPGCRLGDIGEVIQKHAEKNGFSVVREFCGHGIGKVFHEEPQILHYGRAGTGMELKAGMTFTIEPMINQGKADTKVLGDGWTAITKDRKLSAQWEHTLLVTETGYEIFTLRADDTIPRVSA